LIIGATHGNEPAGYYCIKEMMNLLNKQIISLKKGKIIFVPVVNYCGYQFN
jgi:predicted deacylase